MKDVSGVAYKLEELARAAGTSPRTIRYYVQRGLLPAPAFRGKDTAYGSEHLVRLRAIRRLQDAFLPLDAIAVELARRSDAEVERLADGKDLPALATAAEPPVARVAAKAPERVFRRIEIAPGVELSIADDAPLASRRTAEKILRAVAEQGEGR